jgi:TonB family protein
MSIRIRLVLIALLVLQSWSFRAVAVAVDVYVGRPRTVIHYVSPEYPPSLASLALGGKSRFLLTVNPKSGFVDEVKILKSTGHVVLNELAAKALLQWRFQPGSATKVEVPVEFYAHGFSRDLH